MKFKYINVFLAILLLSHQRAVAQQAGTLETEEGPTIALKSCTIADGCTSRQARLTLDANWRWVHEADGFQNCYTGDQWDSQRCSDPVECAKNCGKLRFLDSREST